MMSANLKAETKNWCESVIIFLSNFLRPQIIIPGLENIVQGPLETWIIDNTFSSFMNHVKFAGGWDCQEVQSASKVSPIWYFSLIPVILGFSSGRSENENNLWDQNLVLSLCLLNCNTYQQPACVLTLLKWGMLYLPLLHNCSFQNCENLHFSETRFSHQTKVPEINNSVYLVWKWSPIKSQSGVVK